MEEQDRFKHVLVSVLFKGGLRPIYPKKSYKLGRAPECEVSLPTNESSRHHATLEWRSDCFILSDNGSMNGTFVNNEKIGEHFMRDGDTIQIGPFELTYKQVRGSLEQFSNSLRVHEQGTVAQSEAAASGKMAGEFDGIELAHVWTIVELNGKSGHMRVQSTDLVGLVEFSDGQIVGSKAGAYRGKEALIRMCGLKGTYEFTEKEVKDNPARISPADLLGEVEFIEPDDDDSNPLMETNPHF